MSPFTFPNRCYYNNGQWLLIVRTGARGGQKLNFRTFWHPWHRCCFARAAFVRHQRKIGNVLLVFPTMSRCLRCLQSSVEASFRHNSWGQIGISAHPFRFRPHFEPYRWHRQLMRIISGYLFNMYLFNIFVQWQWKRALNVSPLCKRNH